jgi:hypothetical protein
MPRASWYQWNFVQTLNKKIRNTYQYENETEAEAGASQGKDTTSNLKEIPPKLKPGDIIYYTIFHDESTVHANEQSHFVWETDDQHELRQKSRGRLIHISDFIIEHCRRLVLTPVRGAAPKAATQPCGTRGRACASGSRDSSRCRCC